MKNKIIVIIILAVSIFILSKQPKYYNIKIDNNNYKVILINNTIYSNCRLKYYKLFKEKVIAFKFYDIDKDGSEEILILTKRNSKSNFGDFLVIYDTDVLNQMLVATEVYRQDFSSINPWKVDACNLDNDMDVDIFIGVNKSTIFYKDVRNRPFFYSWDGKKLYKKWEGSFFTDWDLVDIAFGDYLNIGHDIAAVLEKNINNENRIGLYKFTGFGFLNIATSENNQEMHELETKLKIQFD